MPASYPNTKRLTVTYEILIEQDSAEPLWSYNFKQQLVVILLLIVKSRVLYNKIDEILFYIYVLTKLWSYIEVRHKFAPIKYKIHHTLYSVV